MYETQRIRMLAGWGFLQWMVALALWLGSSRAGFTEGWATGLGIRLATLLARLSGAVPFPLAELLYGSLGLGFLAWAAWSVLHLVRSGRRWRRALERIAFELSIATSGTLVAFQLTFGLAYARAPLSDRLGLVPPDPSEAPDAAYTELRALTERFVDLANAAYIAVHATPDTGAPTVMDRQAMELAIERGYSALPERYGFEPTMAGQRPPTRAMAPFNPVPAFGVAGFYTPFTGEAMVDSAIPDFYEGFVMAHEKAHQRLIAPEDEADFVGFLAALHSDDGYARYCAWVEASTKALLHLARVDPVGAEALAQRFVPGIRRDLEAADAYFTASPSFTRSFGAAVNDAYLRANAQELGNDSYRHSFQLLVAWARRYPDLEPGMLADPGVPR
ncbi:MAG: DUF3810 domain-containing protein [Myxococcota bacterium]